MVKMMPAPFSAVLTTLAKMKLPCSSALFSSMYSSYFIKPTPTNTDRQDEPFAHELAFFLLSSSAWASAFLIMFSISSLDRPPEDWITTETAQTLLLAVSSLQILVVFLNMCNWRNISKSHPNQIRCDNKLCQSCSGNNKLITIVHLVIIWWQRGNGFFHKYPCAQWQSMGFPTWNSWHA